MIVLGVIPARYASTRFPGKPLAMIAGRPMLEWVVRGVQESKKINRVLVASDHPEILNLAKSLNVEAVETSPDCVTGTDRVWQAVQNQKCDVIVNIQGDEPLIRGSVLDQLVTPFEVNADLAMATLGTKFQSEEDLKNSQTAKIVLNRSHQALYFSRYPIPYSRNPVSGKIENCLKHLGLYAYKKSFLSEFCEQGAVGIELSEGLEQLRALYLGAKIQVVEVEHESWGVDVPGDIARVEKMLNAKILAERS